MPQDAIGPIRLKPTQQRAIAALSAAGSAELTRAQYEELAAVSRSQAAYDLGELVQAGVLHRVGSGRSTRYRLARDGGAHRRWTEERIRVELAEFCGGRDTWPSSSEFKRAGRGDLYIAASRYGGVAHWAETLGLARPARTDRSEPRVATAALRSPLRARLAWSGAGALAALGLAGTVAALAVTLGRVGIPVAGDDAPRAVLREQVSDESLHPAARKVARPKSSTRRRSERSARVAKPRKPTRPARPATTASTATVTAYVSSRSAPPPPPPPAPPKQTWSSATPAPSVGPAPLRAPPATSVPAPMKAP